MNDMKVAPARADMAANKASTSEVTRSPLPAATITPKPVPARGEIPLYGAAGAVGMGALARQDDYQPQ